MVLDPIQLRAAAEIEMRKRNLAAIKSASYGSDLNHIWPWQIPPGNIVVVVDTFNGKERIRRFEDVPKEELAVSRVVTRPWKIWILRCGRGAGKSFGGSKYVIEHFRKFGKDARVAAGGPSFASAREVCMEGRSGLYTLYGNEFVKYNRANGEAWHIRGGKLKLMGSENPDRWNGPEWSLIWADELALWNQLSWEMALFGLRVGQWPQAIVTTTPKQRPFVREIENEATTVVTRAATRDNADLPEDTKSYLESKYAGTRLGLQELEGEWIIDVEGALFKREWIENNRDFSARSKDMKRIVIAVDPAMSHHEGADETAIGGAGVDSRGHYYVFSSNGYHLSPEGWARKVIEIYNGLGASKIIGEKNNGGDMVQSTIKAVERNVPVKLVHAFKGKKIRGEPVAALYEQGKVHHVGAFPDLEDQMCSFTGDEDASSAAARRAHKGQHFDRMDAVIYCILELMARSGGNRDIRVWTANRSNPWRM